MTGDRLDQLIREHQEHRLRIGEQLALLKVNWRQANGKGLGTRKVERAWRMFLAEQRFPNPSNTGPDYITAPAAEQLIDRFSQHLLEGHLAQQQEASHG